jgi:hypothetical protein
LNIRGRILKRSGVPGNEDDLAPGLQMTQSLLGHVPPRRFMRPRIEPGRKSSPQGEANNRRRSQRDQTRDALNDFAIAHLENASGFGKHHIRHTGSELSTNCLPQLRRREFACAPVRHAQITLQQVQVPIPGRID